MIRTDVLVIGGGGAGMVAALRAAEAGAEVLLLARTAPGTECNSAVSGGGLLIAGPNIGVEEHRRLTMDVGHGINEPQLVQVLSEKAPACREWLEATIGFPLNVKDKGQGYWCPGGGANLSAKLAQAVARTERIAVRALKARQLLVEGDICRGVLAEDADGLRHHVLAAATVLATGGYAGLFARHDNPGAPIGSGVVMAARAGARLRDLEFVQFYPVATAEPRLPTFMLFRPFPPEARLITGDGRDLLAEAFGNRSLNEVVGAQRDELSKAIYTENSRGQVYFDATGCDWSQVDRWFSLRFISQYDFDWASQPARIAPIAHHSMGGIWIDPSARTSIRRLYAAGEAAAGVHGANRHGSNSLTDCLVFGSVAGNEAAGEEPLRELPDTTDVNGPLEPERAAFEELQRICWEGGRSPLNSKPPAKGQGGGIEATGGGLGIVRNGAGLAATMERLAALPPSDARLMASMVAEFALRRTESRGAHYRSDYPLERDEWRVSQVARLDDGRLTPSPFGPLSL